MIQKKICMLGTFTVGKTSLVRRFVESIYSDEYQTTVGVKIDKKVVQVGDQETMLLLWDLQGEESVQDLRRTYLRGAAGYLLVADGTRRDTFYKTRAIQAAVEETLGAVPFLLLINKYDLRDQWILETQEIEEVANSGWQVIMTSAKDGLGVEEAFLTLAQKMLET
ncbi:MAG TPA: Rab family GTPase [Pyrinomonadaceae bacterium]|nr:Rab family GTPase [Pyrinomonadaceae bacterium]